VIRITTRDIIEDAIYRYNQIVKDQLWPCGLPARSAENKFTSTSNAVNLVSGDRTAFNSGPSPLGSGDFTGALFRCQRAG
jgi:hypothetical protein